MFRSLCIDTCHYNDLTGARAKQLRCTVGEITFIVKSGNIVEQKCDAIVNSTDEKLDLRRGMFV